MAEIIKNPELRYTSDNQMAVTDMFVQFSPPPGSRPDERSPTIEVVGWGKLATEIKENYKIGDRVTIEGRLEMITIERDGYKEKRAKLVASQIYHLAIVLQLLLLGLRSHPASMMRKITFRSSRLKFRQGERDRFPLANLTRSKVTRLRLCLGKTGRVARSALWLNRSAVKLVPTQQLIQVEYTQLLRYRPSQINLDR
jgi:hypothetical protein